MAKISELGRKLAHLDAEIARLQSIRAFLTEALPEPEKPRTRIRKTKAKGLPKEPTP